MVGGSTGLAGRDAEVARLVAVARDGALLVAGEAGSGKTAIVRAAADVLAGEVAVLWTAALPLATVAAPLLPLRTALVRGDDGGYRAPESAFGPGDDATAAFDTWLARIRGDRPALLVVDDLQWADPSSLDVLTYVLAGPPGRDVTVLATLRTGDGPEAPRLRRWLADVRRLPRVDELALGRLDRDGVRDQVAAALGGAPRESLVDDVFARTLGNPYLTSLLIRGVPPGATVLPPDRPAELRDAVSRTWLDLPLPARAATEFLAVAGRPQRAADLEAVSGTPPDLRPAVIAGVLRVDSADRYWFTHPLLAEMLVEGLLPEERRALHAAFAGALESTGDSPAIELAEHHWQAGHREPAYRWALRAAEAAEAAGGAGTAVQLLRRAVELAPAGGGEGIALLRRVHSVAQRGGRDEDELIAVEDLLTTPDPTMTLERRAELLVRRVQLRHRMGRAFADESDSLQACALLADRPPGPEAALAEAQLAWVEIWHARPGAAGRARRAIALARAAGGGRPLAYALVAASMAELMAGGPDAETLAREAQRVAARCRDFYAFQHATAWIMNAMDRTPAEGRPDLCRAARQEAEALGSPRSYLAGLAALEAGELLPLGRWRDCQDALRLAMAAEGGTFSDTVARLIAAQLACRQGRAAESYGHLARAEELFAEQSTFVALEFDGVRAELAAAAGDCDAAVGAALTGLSNDVVPTSAERLLPTAAKALADRAGQLRDHGHDPTDALGRLDELRTRYPAVVCDVGEGPGWESVRVAMQVWYEAEVARAHAHTAAWANAAEACRTAGLPWDEAYCRWRDAEAAASRRPSHQSTRDAVRRAYRLASDLEATPLLAELGALAATTRISLRDEPVAVPEQRGLTDRLTRREREVLGHLVAGRTYAEIAAALFLSEKTVSVHVSNMLRKTGSANRIELIRLAGRTVIPRTPRA